jgi:hypothetical protein
MAMEGRGTDSALALPSKGEHAKEEQCGWFGKRLRNAGNSIKILAIWIFWLCGSDGAMTFILDLNLSCGKLSLADTMISSGSLESL